MSTITIITRKAYGGAYDVMSSKHIRGNRKLKAFSHACSVFDDNDEVDAEGRLTIAMGIPTPKLPALPPEKSSSWGL